jgi:hypothetical protein
MTDQTDNPYAAPQRSAQRSSLPITACVRIGTKGLIGFVVGLVVGAVVSVVAFVVAILVSGGTLRIIRVAEVGYCILACWAFVGLLGFVVFARREFRRRTHALHE